MCLHWTAQKGNGVSPAPVQSRVSVLALPTAQAPSQAPFEVQTPAPVPAPTRLLVSDSEDPRSGAAGAQSFLVVFCL